MKLWDKGYKSDNIVEKFTIGEDRELDQHLIKYDLIASKAHAAMLGSIGILTPDEVMLLNNELSEMQKQLLEGNLKIEDSFEDMHSKIEYDLIQKLGETGKKIHTGRSRNDQVLVCMHLYLKDELTEIKALIKSLFNLLIEKSNLHKDVIIPGYTHLQAAMPSSFGLWFGAYAESLIDDLYLVNAAYKVADQNPLGSAAGYGSSFQLNRTQTTEALGFDTMKYNVVAAQMSRGKVEKTAAYAISAISATVGKMAMDICLYMSQNFGFLSFPNELTTGSSIMPHKKNPDIFELTRAKCNKLQNLPMDIGLITNNLPSGYHRDLQLVKEILIPGIETLKSCLDMTIYALAQVTVNEEAINDSRYDYIYTVESLNQLVQTGVPFREAYRIVGTQVDEGTYAPDKSLEHSHEGSIGNLCNDKIEEKFMKAWHN